MYSLLTENPEAAREHFLDAKIFEEAERAYVLPRREGSPTRQS
jgi:hypothetical protein